MNSTIISFHANDNYEKVWCEDPETNKETKTFVTKTYLTYRVLMKQDGRDLVGVRHRYSEFETLRSSIASKFVPLGIAIPMLPPKKPMTSAISGTNTEKIFIKERTRGLSLFVESLCENIFLRHDISWKAFMRPSVGSSFQVLDDGDENIAEKELIKALNDSNLDIKKGTTNFIRLKEEIHIIEKHVKSALSKLRTIQDYERKLAQSCEEYVSSLFTWSEKEKSDVKFLRGLGDDSSCDVRSAEQVSNTIGQLSLVATSQAMSTKAAPDYSGVLLAACLEHELSRVESFKELFKFYDELVFNIEAARKSEKFVTLAFDEQRLHRFMKGVFFVTIPVATRQRCAMFRNACSMVVSTTTTASSKLFTDTINFFNNISMDPTKAVDEGALMMNLLSMPLGDRGNVPIMSMDPSLELTPPQPPFYGIFYTPGSSSQQAARGVDVVKQYEEVLLSSSTGGSVLNTPSSTPAPYSKPVNPLAKRTSVVNNRRTSATEDIVPGIITDPSLPLPPNPATVTLDDGTSLKSLTVSSPQPPTNDDTANSPASANNNQRRQSAALAALLDMNDDSNKKSPFDD